MMINEINKAFGLDFQISKKEKIRNVPIFMTIKREFYEASNGVDSFLLVKVSDDEKFGVVALEKQRRMYEEKTDMQIAYWFVKLTRSQRDSLIGHHIPFVAEDKQLYLPFLGISIQNSFKNNTGNVKTDKMMPVTQSLFLYLIYECANKKVLKKQAADKLNVTKTSITRASEQLKKMGLIQQEKTGKEIYMCTVADGYKLFLMAKKYLINPVQESFVIEKNTFIQEKIISGETALSRYSMLNPSRIESVAMDKELAKSYSPEKVDEIWNEDKELIRIESWKYDPNKFSKKGVVDPISLYMTLSDHQDERIEGALEEMMEGYKW